MLSHPKNRRPKFRLGMNLCIALLAMSLCSCTHFPDTLVQKGMVAWNYEPVGATHASLEPIPVTLRITNLESEPAGIGTSCLGDMLRLFPVLSLFASPMFTFTNQVEDCCSNTDLKEWEVEHILAGELRNAGFSSVVLEGGDRDFDIRGDVNFYYRFYRHFSGLGLLYLGILPYFTLPSDTGHLVCEANFQIVSASDQQVVFEKSYSAMSKYLMGFSYGNRNRHFEEYGKEVFPKIVDSFITDIQHLPRTAWHSPDQNLVEKQLSSSGL